MERHLSRWKEPPRERRKRAAIGETPSAPSLSGRRDGGRRSRRVGKSHRAEPETDPRLLPDDGRRPDKETRPSPFLQARRAEGRQGEPGVFDESTACVDPRAFAPEPESETAVRPKDVDPRVAEEHYCRTGRRRQFGHHFGAQVHVAAGGRGGGAGRSRGGGDYDVGGVGDRMMAPPFPSHSLQPLCLKKPLFFSHGSPRPFSG